MRRWRVSAVLAASIESTMRRRLLYDKPSIQGYADHCRRKAVQTIAAETADSLSGLSGFPRREFSRARSGKKIQGKWWSTKWSVSGSRWPAL